MQKEIINNLASALICFHKEVGKVSKNNTNPYFKSKYGDLNAYLDVIREPLANSGLALIQLPITGGLKTILMHTSGESMETEIIIPELSSDPQKVGAALTYLRRYSIAAILMLNAEDDDGESCKPTQKKEKSDIQKKVDQDKEDKIIELEQITLKMDKLTDAQQDFIKNVRSKPLPQIVAALERMKIVLESKEKQKADTGPQVPTDAKEKLKEMFNGTEEETAEDPLFSQTDEFLKEPKQ